MTAVVVMLLVGTWIAGALAAVATIVERRRATRNLGAT
jgi:hypothetical protein